MNIKTPTGERCALTTNNSRYFILRLFSLLAVSTIMCLYARAQEDIEWTPAASGRSAPIEKGLKVGDTIPDELWNMPLSLWSAAVDSTKIITLNDYKGKAIIIDFWATWCSACIFYMPHQFELQGRFGDDIFTLPITYEPLETIRSYTQNSASERFKPIKPVFYTVVENDELLKRFPLNKSLPLVVSISPMGTIDAITVPEMLTEEYVSALVNGEERYAPLKRTGIDQVPKLLSFSIDDVKQHKEAFYTMITGEIDGADAVEDVTIDTLNGSCRVLLANHTIIGLYSCADLTNGRSRGFGFTGPGTQNRRILEVKDPQIYDHYFDETTGLRTVFNITWNRRHRYTYESIMPIRLLERQKRKLATDLNDFFGLVGRIEKRKMDVLVLSTNEDFDPRKHQKTGPPRVIKDGWLRLRTAPDTLLGPNKDGYRTYMQNMPIKSLPTEVNALYNQTGKDDQLLPHIIDETGLTGIVNLGFPDRESATLAKIQKVLSEQGFDLEKQKREIDMFILTEPGYEQAGGELVLTKYGYIPKASSECIK